MRSFIDLFFSREEELPASILLDYGLWVPLQGNSRHRVHFGQKTTHSHLFLGAPQVDEQSVFRHRGERKVKTVEEDMEEITSGAAELLEEGEELMGRRRGNISWL